MLNFTLGPSMFQTKNIYMRMCHQSKELHVLTEEERTLLQTHLRAMYVEVEKVCNRHGLTVMLADGSVLGAVRHGGFIPWDDDIDLNMPRKDYDLFINEYASELPSHYMVYAPNSKNGPISNFAKVVDVKTTIIEPGGENSPVHHGISLDIFPLESIIPDRRVYNGYKKILSMALIYIIGSVSQYHSHSKLYRRLMTGCMAGKFNYWFRKFVGFIFSFRSREAWQNTFDIFVRNVDNTGYVHRPSDVYKWEAIPLDVYLPVKRVQFDDIMAYIPNKPEFLLEYDYGDWRRIPPKEERWEHFLVKISFSNDESKE